jgi:flagellar motor protein MotB
MAETHHPPILLPPANPVEHPQGAEGEPLSIHPAAAESATSAHGDWLRPGPAESSGQLDWHKGHHWSLPWGDLMMVMFVLFAVLVTLQMRENQRLVESAERQQEAAQRRQEEREMESAVRERVEVREQEKIEPQPQPQPQPQPLPFPSLQPLPQTPGFTPLLRVNVFERSREAVRAAHLENVEIVLLEDESVKVSVQGPLLFELGEAVLRPQVRTFLDRLAGVIEQTPYAIQVIGHTDDYPVDTATFPSNWELSAARAASVARYLIDSADIDPRRFTVMGRGEFAPAVANTSDANRARNRRVEIIITRDTPEPPQTPE